MPVRDFLLRTEQADGKLQTASAASIEGYGSSVELVRQVLFVTPAWNSTENETFNVDIFLTKPEVTNKLNAEEQIKVCQISCRRRRLI